MKKFIEAINLLTTKEKKGNVIMSQNNIYNHKQSLSIPFY